MKIKLELAAMSMARHAEYHKEVHPDWGTWLPGNPDQPEQTLYLNPWNRFRIIYEHHSEAGFGLQRSEEAAEQDIDISAKDAREFTQNFLDMMGDHMSIYNLNIFIEEITKARDEWERERLAALAKLENMGH